MYTFRAVCEFTQNLCSLNSQRVALPRGASVLCLTHAGRVNTQVTCFSSTIVPSSPQQPALTTTLLCAPWLKQKDQPYYPTLSGDSPFGAFSKSIHRLFICKPSCPRWLVNIPTGLMKKMRVQGHLHYYWFTH